MSSPFVGIIVPGISLIDEGADRVMDYLRSTIGVTTIFLPAYSHSSVIAGRLTPNPSEPWRDHGMPEPMELKGGAFFDPHTEFYRNTFIHDFRAPDPEYRGVDVMALAADAARPRGIDVVPYFLDALGHGRRDPTPPGFPHTLEVDALGRLSDGPCLTNPAYGEWVFSLVEDLMKSYPAAGLLWGMERHGPLGQVIDGGAPVCFCDHCCRAARDAGLDPVAARADFEAAWRYVEAVRVGELRPTDGYFIGFLRELLRHPQALVWEKFWLTRYHGFLRRLYGLVKHIDHRLRFGILVWHNANIWPLLRAQWDYAEIREFCDYLLPLVTHNTGGVSVVRHLESLAATAFKDVRAPDLLAGFYRIMGYDEGPWDGLPARGFGPEYTRREIRRVVDGAGGRVPVYAGVGIDLPTPPGIRKTAPEDVEAHIRAAHAAGASGFAFRRSYAEMWTKNLEAAGRTLRVLGVIE
ncbi:MAG: hypothetical protein HY660_14405 [Armatimonadetes bacterium]|nr:hypothetical protein [Armatimonadota bacterium]